MYRSIQVGTAEEQERFCALPGSPALNADVLARQRPDQLWLLTDNTGAPVARCALWWNGTPPHEDHRLGLIGHYSASDPWAADALLQLACDRLAAHGCTL